MTPELRKLIKEDLIRQEKVEYKAYRCSLGHLTIGVGHKITDKDPKGFYSTRISDEEVERLLEEDLDEAIEDTEMFVKGELEELPETVQRVLVNMHFQMGFGRMTGFSRMILVCPYCYLAGDLMLMFSAGVPAAIAAARSLIWELIWTVRARILASGTFVSVGVRASYWAVIPRRTARAERITCLVDFADAMRALFAAKETVAMLIFVILSVGC